MAELVDNTETDDCFGCRFSYHYSVSEETVIRHVHNFAAWKTLPDIKGGK